MTKQLPKYAIINDVDKPCPRLVCQLINDKYYYLSRLEEPHMKSYDGIQAESPTDIQDFGFSVLQRGEVVHFFREFDSVATYHNKDKQPNPVGIERYSSSPREWQDSARSFHYKMVTLADLSQPSDEQQLTDDEFKANMRAMND